MLHVSTLYIYIYYIYFFPSHEFYMSIHYIYMLHLLLPPRMNATCLYTIYIYIYVAFTSSPRMNATCLYTLLLLPSYTQSCMVRLLIKKLLIQHIILASTNFPVCRYVHVDKSVQNYRNSCTCHAVSIYVIVTSLNKGHRGTDLTSITTAQEGQAVRCA